jgi:hypothetical protein
MAYPLLFYPFTLFKGSPEGLAPLVAARNEDGLSGSDSLTKAMTYCAGLCRPWA